MLHWDSVNVGFLFLVPAPDTVLISECSLSGKSNGCNKFISVIRLFIRQSYAAGLLAVVFIASGCAQSLSLAKLMHDPMRGSLTRLRAVLVELAETNTAAKPEERGQDKPSNLTINADAKEHG
jgi:hypothetical protein